MSRLDYPIEWAIGSRELVLNNHRTADGGYDQSKLEQGYYQVEAFDFSPIDMREQREGYHLLTGGDLGPANRQFRHISLRGSMVGGSQARLDDMEAAFLAAFDLEHAQLDSPDDYGLGILKHTSETEFSGPGIGTRVFEGFYCRPESYPVSYVQRGPRGIVRAFAAQLVSGYPYRCLFPQQSVVFSAAAGWTQELPNWNALTGGTSRLRLDIVHTTGGDTNLTISDGTRSLVLDMSATGAGTLTIEMWSKQIYNASLDPKDSLRTSDIDSFFDVPPGGASVSISNVASITSVTATYNQTRA